MLSFVCPLLGAGDFACCCKRVFAYRVFRMEHERGLRAWALNIVFTCCFYELFRLYILEPSYMPSVRVKENEPFEVAMRRFKRTVEKTGLLTELRAREFYEKPTAERKRKLAAAVKRHFKRIRSQTLPPKLY